MINKIYEKIKNFIINNYKELIFLIIGVIVITYELPYFIYTGGGILDLEEKVYLKDSDSIKGSYNLAYVREIRATIPNLLIGKIMNWGIDKIDVQQIGENDDMDTIWKRNRISLEQSISSAIISAYKQSGEDILIKGEKYHIISIDSKAETTLKVGDIILKIENVPINNREDINDILKEQKESDIIHLTVLRDNKEIECTAKLYLNDNSLIMGIYMITTFDYEIERVPEIKFSNKEAGASGGFMLSLSLYDKLTEGDLTKGRKIVGTGTIDADLNVGEIGGVKYKLKGAVKNKADIFFVPSGDNYNEAIKEQKKHNYKIKIVEVSKLTDAINYLEGE